MDLCINTHTSLIAMQILWEMKAHTDRIHYKRYNKPPAGITIIIFFIIGGVGLSP
jgi:hypothetical protein